MHSLAPSGLVRGLPVLVAVAALGACGADPPSTEEARSAGRDYGRAIVETVGEHASRDEMETLCGKAARDEAEKAGGHQADATVDAFIDGCLEAVAGTR